MGVENGQSGLAILSSQKIMLIAQQGATELMNSPLTVDNQDHWTMMVYADCKLWPVSQWPCF